MWRALKPEPRVDYINVSKMPADKKQLLWAGIKKTNPGLASLLKDDNIKMLRTKFDASPIFDSNVAYVYIESCKCEGNL